MALNIFAVLLVLGMTFFNSIFGLFSGLINVFCTIVSLCVAYGFFETLNGVMVQSMGLHPAYATPSALIGLFVITLIILRTAADNLIRGNVRVPAAVDWVGGGLCGFVNAMCVTGILVSGFTMLPFGPSAAGFEREVRTTSKVNGRNAFERNSVWFAPDAFAAGLFSMISSGSAKGETEFASAYPSFPLWVSWSGNTLQQESSPAVFSDKDGDGVKDGIAVEKWWEHKGGVEGFYRSNVATRLEDPKYEPQTYTAAPGNQLIGMNITLKRASADREKMNAIHNFRPTMLRLVGRDARGPWQGTPVVIVGADKVKSGAPRVTDPDSTFSLQADGDVNLDLYFEVPSTFQPSFVEYRRFARAEVGASNKGKTPTPRTLTVRTPQEQEMFNNISNAGFLNGATMASDTGDNEKLPFGMSPEGAAGPDVVLNAGDGKFVSGRLQGSRQKLASRQGEKQIDSIARPEGKRIVQVRVRPREARTLAGDVFNFTAQLDQYFLVDGNNNRYPLAGYFGMMKRGGDDYLELFFTPDPVDSGFRGMIDFKTMKPKDLIEGRDESVLGLIFVVPPGITFTRIETAQHKKVEFTIQSNQNPPPPQ